MVEKVEKAVESKTPSSEPPRTETPSEAEQPQPPTLPPAPTEEKPKDVAAGEKALVPVAAPVEKVPEPYEKKPGDSSIDRDAVLARVETEKRMSLIKAWEDSEKCKAENKAAKKTSSIDAWENSKKASIEAALKLYEEKMEKKKAAYAEKMKNKIAVIHKEAEEKNAMVEAQKGEEILKAEEVASKYRATGKTPKKMFGCF